MPFYNFHVKDLFRLPTLMHNSLYSLTICMLHYNPPHVSSINMPIFRRINCIITASGIVTLCTVQHSRPDESRLQIADTILDMFRALMCPSLRGQIVLSQYLVSSLSVNGCTVCLMRADCPLYCTVQRVMILYYHSIWYRHSL